jgi:redox-sensitive bicupin YhaK (pirin superfamily)
MKVKNIKIEWTYPVNYNKSLKHYLSSENGLYQISRLFGKKETLIYIGIVKSPNRTFKQRLKEHHKYWMQNYRGVIKIRFGIIQGKQGLQINPQLIEDAESVLIYELKPFENTQKTRSYFIKKDLQVESIGRRGFSPKVVSSCTH